MTALETDLATPRALVKCGTWLFDLDGTLVDSAQAHAAAFVRTLQIHDPGLAATFDYGQHAGRDTVAVFAALGLLPSDAVRLADRKRTIYQTMVAAGDVSVVDGALALLRRLTQEGRDCYIVTAGHRASVQPVLRRTGLGSLVRGVLTGDEVAAAKPAPDGYVEACRRWLLDPADVVAVEDSEAGGRAARAAGLPVIEVTINASPVTGAGRSTLLDVLTWLDD